MSCDYLLSDTFSSFRGQADYVTAAVDSVIHIHKNEMNGDILVFVTGQDEVEEICSLLREKTPSLKQFDKLWIVPLYGALPHREQVDRERKVREKKKMCSR